MKRRSFDLLSGILVAVILLLMLAAGWLIFSIADQELSINGTPISWPTALFQPQNGNVASTPTIVQMQTLNPSTATPVPSATPMPAPALPEGHPTAGPQPQTCDECHQNIHGGGG